MCVTNNEHICFKAPKALHQSPISPTSLFLPIAENDKNSIKNDRIPKVKRHSLPKAIEYTCRKFMQTSTTRTVKSYNITQPHLLCCGSLVGFFSVELRKKKRHLKAYQDK